MSNAVYCHVMDSPVGELRLTHDRQGLTSISFHGAAAAFGGGLPIKRQLLALERSVVMREGLPTGSAMQLPLENLL